MNFQKSGNFYFFAKNPTFRIYGKCTLNLRKSLYNFMSIPNHYRIGEVSDDPEIIRRAGQERDNGTVQNSL